MPLIEFIGYTREEAERRLRRYAPLLERLEFADTFVFVLGGDSTAVSLDGSEQPLVRVRSRYQRHNELTREVLREFEDVETLVVDFHPRRGGQ